MTKNKYKVKIEWILIFLLFFSMFKISYIPGVIRQLIKVASIIILLLFLVSNTPRKKLLNISLVFSGCIILSGVISYLNNINTLRSLLESFIYALLFYDAYTLIQYFSLKNKMSYFLEEFYKIVFTFSAINFVSIILLGREGNMEPIYLLGNKFSVAYMLILLISLFGATHVSPTNKNTIKYYLLIFVSILICIYMRSITALISLIFVLFASIFKNKISILLKKPYFILSALILSLGVVFIFDALLSNSEIGNLVFNVFNKSTSIYGRQVIYNTYLKTILENGRMIWGSGYNNSIIYEMSNGVFGNAQNGLFQHLISFGIIGVCAILITAYYCLNNSDKDDNKIFYILLVSYAMIVAATVEVSINWYFFIGLFIVSNINKNEKIDIAVN